MAVQLLEEWLLKEQAKLQQNYRELNQVSVKEPDIIFIGDSIVEYYPLYELLQTDKRLVNRGIRGYKTDLLLDNLDVHLFGQALDKVFILIGTNDIGKEMPQTETLSNLEAVIQEISRDYPWLRSNCYRSCRSMKLRPTRARSMSAAMRRFRPSIRPIASWLTPT